MKMIPAPMDRIAAGGFSGLLFLLCLTISNIMEPTLACHGQDADVVDEASQVVGNSLSALETIQRDYVAFLANRKRILDDLQRIEDTLRKTEDDFERIGNDAVRQQLLAMQSAVRSMQLETTLRVMEEQRVEALRRRDRTTQGIRRSLLDQHRQVLETQQAMADLETQSRRVELSQLDAASQAIVRRRIECFQNGLALQQEWVQWQQDWLGFMARYWPHSDPERIFTRAEIEARLEILKNSDPEDFAADITSALLLERLGMLDQALATVDRVIAAETALGPTALCVKALVLYSIKKDKDAKQALQTAGIAQTKSPYERWIRARIAVSRKQYSEAEAEWKALAAIKTFEIEARRSLALIHYARLEKSSKESKKALKEAQLAYDLEPTHEWYSHLVLGMAFSAAKMEPEALEQLKQAEEKASDENLELCTHVRQAIQQGQVIEWDFLSRFDDRKR